MAQLPSGTVTTLFTDIEGSTELLRKLGTERYREELDLHRELLRAAFAGHGGHEVDMQGDSFHVAFGRAADALAAAAEAQRMLVEAAWPHGEPIAVRMGIHTGEPSAAGESYVGIAIHRAARVMAAAHGGQVLLSEVAASLVRDDLPDGMVLRDLGEHRLKDLPEPQRLFQLGIGEFPPPRTVEDLAAEPMSPTPVPAPVGRDAEHEAVLAILAALPTAPAAVLLTGDGGIGKTTVWEAGINEARRRSYRVLSFRAGPSEMQLSFGGLGDLLEGVLLEVQRELPTPQRRALEAALGVIEIDATPEPRLLGVALLNVFRTLARERPLVVAIDDLQWLDQPTAELLVFALRRLESEPVTVLATARGAPDAGAPFQLDRALGERLTRLAVGPLSLGAVQHLLRERLATPVARRLVRRIHERSGGNPFYALELARVVAEHGEDRLPESLRAIVADRIERLPIETRSLLLILAAAAQPTLVLVRELGAEDAFEAAEREQVVVIDDSRVRFSHPLLAAVVNDGATTRERRAAHARLADLVAEPEQHARHLALAAEGPDETIASALDRGASTALTRGATGSAAELAQQALALTPPAAREAIHRRRLEAAKRCRTVGDTGRARGLLEEALAGAVVERERAEPLRQLAALALDEGDGVGGRALIEEALDCAKDDDQLSAAILLDAAVADWGYNLEAAQAAVDHAEHAGEPTLEALALSALAHASFSHGLGFRRDLYERALELERSAAFMDVGKRPSWRYGMTAKWAGDIPLGRELLEQSAARASEDEDASATIVLFSLAWLHLISGEYERAIERAEEGRQIAIDAAREGDAAAVLITRAIVEGHMGRLEESRAHLEEARLLSGDRAAARGDLSPLSRGWAGVLTATSTEQLSAAATDLQAAIAEKQAYGIVEPGIHPWFPACVEALAQVGRLDEAAAMAEWFQAHAVRPEPRWARAMAAHMQGMVAAARTETEAALELLERAVELHEGVGRPFDRARTLLVYGETLRRARRRRLARETLSEALAEFERLGAEPWAERARAALARIGGRTAAASGSLTPTEQRIAALVADGKSNKEVAAELFVTVRTVETQLSRIYAKLGLRSRTELSAHLARS